MEGSFTVTLEQTVEKRVAKALALAQTQVEKEKEKAVEVAVVEYLVSGASDGAVTSLPAIG